MKNRITQLFSSKPEGVLSVYFTAGYPHLEDTMTVLEALQESGADMVEIGMPYSDPVADGPTIQESNKKALENGISISGLFDQISTMREQIDIPVVLMGYVNPVLQYGVEKFCEKCGSLGIDGVILPDLPRAEYMDIYQPFFEAHDLFNIALITPQTSEERIVAIDAYSSGFIYMVSTSSTTGSRADISDTQIAYFKRVRDMGLRNPLLIGFGISDAPTFSRACRYAHGAIIGSAFINMLSEGGNIRDEVRQFIGSIKGPVS